MQEVILFYNGLGIPTRQILDSRGAIPSKTAADAKVAITPCVLASDEEIEGPMTDQPLSADASPIALSPGYIADSDLEEDKEDPEEDPSDHPADG
ncbi:hypothetical protein Tco_0628793 [Tanacetum coccineum]|uniref:Uncharacterized protein n=1 Tax=Tanacetum coccineum TaxID=301880 RepID=A0ABQ4WRD3_9ASTR